MNEKINDYIKDYLKQTLQEYIKIKLDENSILSDSKSNIIAPNDVLSMSFSNFIECNNLHSKTKVYNEIISWIINILDSLKQSVLNHFSITKEDDFTLYSYLDILIQHLYYNNNDFILKFMEIDNLSLKELIEYNSKFNSKSY